MSTTTLEADPNAEFSDSCPGMVKGKKAKAAEINASLQQLLNNTANLPIERTKAVGTDDGEYVIKVVDGAVQLIPFERDIVVNGGDYVEMELTPYLVSNTYVPGITIGP